MRALLLSCLFIFSFATSLVSQKLSHHQGQLIVQLSMETDGKVWAGNRSELNDFRQLMRRPNVWLLHFDFNEYAENELRAKYNRDPKVAGIQYNRFVEFRNTTPNDPLFPNQWQYLNTGQIGGLENADVNACPAWDVSTGGLTVNGDTIVICAIDNGVDEDHEDLVPNLWINHDEIPGNGIDDDNNGFIDDYKGWNTANNNNDINGGSHGTSVTGIIGARGNNSIGVTGVNWTTKVMIVRNNFNASESEVLEAYGYALDARIDYDNSGGTAGAYVVATNASWGISNGDPDDSPLWCALYDTLGNYGILSAGATANSNVDVDIVGDLPTACPSDFLLTVTNVNTDDEKVMNAAFGQTTIDLGAHGESVFTTTSGNNYGAFGGTSAATPMVTGAIGLLYSAPSAIFGELLASDPAAAALFIRNIVLDNARPISDLNGITVTGATLDLGSSMEALMDIANVCLAPTSVAVNTSGATALNVSWNVVSSVDEVALRYRPLGSVNWVTFNDVSSPSLLEDLASCVIYELQLLAECGGQNAPVFTTTIETDGCCRRPENFMLSTQSNTSISVDFDDVLAAVNYQIRYRIQGNGAWTEQDIQAAPVLINSLSPCTAYQVEIRSNCDTAATGFGNQQTIQTSGCGVCLDSEYCIPASLDNEAEYIAYFNYGNSYINQSGPETDGYRNYGTNVTLEAARGASYPVELRAEFAGSAFTETFRIWIDYDQNGFFTNSEIVLDAVSSGGSPAIGNILISDTAPVGNTRMRVMMRFNQPTGPCPVGNTFGEIEDYCLEIIASPGCVPPTGLTPVYDETTEEVTISWEASAAPGGNYLLRYRPDGSTGPWEEVETSALSVTLEGFPACQLYDVELYSICGGQSGTVITTAFNSCSDTRNPGVPDSEWSIYPNPSKDRIFLNWANENILREISIIGIDGKLWLQSSNVNMELTTFSLRELPAGIYLVRVMTNGGRIGVKRLVKK